MFEAYTYKTSQGGWPECSKDCQEYGHCLDCEKFAKMMDRLNKYEQAEREGRLVVLPCKVGELLQKYKELTEPQGDEAETYTTGYRNGHRNGQAELIAYLLQIDTGTREAAEKALEVGE